MHFAVCCTSLAQSKAASQLKGPGRKLKQCHQAAFHPFWHDSFVLLLQAVLVSVAFSVQHVRLLPGCWGFYGAGAAHALALPIMRGGKGCSFHGMRMAWVSVQWTVRQMVKRLASGSRGKTLTNH